MTIGRTALLLIVLLLPAVPAPADVPSLAFDPGATTYAPGNALFLVTMVQAAGDEDEASIRQAFADQGFVSARLIRGGGLHCVVARHRDFCLLAFRGSTTTQDWLTDFKFMQMKTKKTGLPGRVHRGFHRMLGERWETLSSELSRAAADGLSVWIAGHSLGGGLAQLAAMRAVEDGIPVAGVYAFAAPKVGDPAFVEAYDERLAGSSYRIVNGDDLVPRVAPAKEAEKSFIAFLGGTNRSVAGLTMKGALLLADYAHAGELYCFDDAGTFRGRRSWRGVDDMLYWQRMKTEYGAIGWLGLIADNSEVAKLHSLNEYIRLLRRAVAGCDRSSR
jgi:triacylglycerol lipase